MSLTTLDNDWVRQAFMLKPHVLNEVDKRNRYYTSASMKFTDTRLGGNFSINNHAQYCRYTDPKVSGRLIANTQGGKHGSRGMGRFYSEQLDDYAQLVHFRFGVAEFNGMISFFTSFYNGELGRLSRTGRSGLLYNVGRIIGFVGSLYVWQYIAIGHFIKFMGGFSSSKYYYLKPTMGLYWNRVNTITNTLGVYLNVVQRVYQDKDPNLEVDPNSKIDDVDRRYFFEQQPDIFRKSGGIDVYAVASRAQRAAHAHYTKLKEMMSSFGNKADFVHKWNEFSAEFSPADMNYPNLLSDGDMSGNDKDRKDIKKDNSYLKKYHETASGNYTKPTTGEDLSTIEVADRPKWKPIDDTKGQTAGKWEAAKTFIDDVAKFSTASLQDGTQFITFKVDYGGSVGESFSSSTKPSSIQSTLNGVSSSGRDLRFSTADGNTGIGLVDGVIKAARDIVGGVADSFHVSGLMSLTGAAWVDIPKQWDESSAQFPRSTFTIELRSPYGHQMARFQNLYIPLACLLAGALPLSTGKQSYTSPFLCEMYYQGHNQIRLGIIDSLTVTRGTGNVGWTSRNEPLGIDVTFSVADMSSVMHAPISPGYNILNPFDGLFDEDSAFNDYMATLASLSMGDQIFTSRKAALNATRKLEHYRSQFSIARVTTGLFDTTPGHLLSAFFRDPSRGFL